MDIIKRLFAILAMLIFPVLAYAQEESIDWKKELQDRYDFSNPLNNQAFCYKFNNIAQFPVISDKNDASLISATKQNLINEKIILRTDNSNERKLIYHYELTEIGKPFLTTFQRLNLTAFCYGMIIVESISEVKSNQINDDQINYTILYRYRIDNIPSWVQSDPYKLLTIDNKQDGNIAIAFFSVINQKVVSNNTQFRFILPFNQGDTIQQ